MQQTETKENKRKFGQPVSNTLPTLKRNDSIGLSTLSKSALQIKPGDLVLGKSIGSGSCGDVYLATWQGTLVAVKKIFHSLLHARV